LCCVSATKTRFQSNDKLNIGTKQATRLGPTKISHHQSQLATRKRKGGKTPNTRQSKQPTNNRPCVKTNKQINQTNRLHSCNHLAVWLCCGHSDKNVLSTTHKAKKEAVVMPEWFGLL
jgi:UDP-2,3-diacylglucosamine pyrophosphatase LpxH